MTRASGWLMALLMLASLLGGCVAPPAPEPPILPPGQSVERPVTPAPIGSPGNPDRSCRVDADCEVKDVGNCCGYYPMCVNRAATVNPEAVRADCAKRGMASVCGFPDIAGCSCVQGQCAADSRALPR